MRNVAKIYALKADEFGRKCWVTVGHEYLTTVTKIFGKKKIRFESQTNECFVDADYDAVESLIFNID